MAKFANSVCFLPAAGGTADFTVSSAVTGFMTPALSGMPSGTYKYRAESANLSQWEIGEGVYNSGTGILTRATVLYNSSGTGSATGQSGAGSKINFSAAPNVGIVQLTEDTLGIDQTITWTSAQRLQGKTNLGLAPATVQVLTSGSGTYNPTSSDVRFIRVRLVGGGGGGANATGAGSQTNTGSGGGGGGYVEHIMAAGSYTYVVGAGGAAQTNGSGSTFNAGALVASGGTGTSFSSGAGTGANRSSGSGAGGAASGGNIANISGENGENGFRYSGSEGIGARGGRSYMSGQSGQALSASSAVSGPAGQAYGGGGGGGSSGSASAASGGAGANGVIIVEEFY